MPSREEALQLLHQHTETESLRRHCLALEAVLREAARRTSSDEQEWGVTGLLHDFDYEQHPEQHPYWGKPLLEERGYPVSMIQAIQAHADFTGVPRETELAHWLFALDELTGFVIACAMVQPGRRVDLVKPSSVRRKLKDKAFARKVRREDVALGAEEVGQPLEVLVELVLGALTPIAAELGLGGPE